MIKLIEDYRGWLEMVPGLSCLQIEMLVMNLIRFLIEES